jgi:hypothetical protein
MKFWAVTALLSFSSMVFSLRISDHKEYTDVNHDQVSGGEYHDQVSGGEYHDQVSGGEYHNEDIDDDGIEDQNGIYQYGLYITK